MKRKTRSYQTGKYTDTVTDGRGNPVKTGTGSTVKSRSFGKAKAPSATAKASKPAPKVTSRKTTASKPKGRTVPVGFNVGQDRPTYVAKNNKGLRPKQGPKDRPDIKGGFRNPLRSDKPLFSAGRARQEIGAMFRGRKRDGTARR